MIKGMFLNKAMLGFLGKLLGANTQNLTVRGPFRFSCSDNGETLCDCGALGTTLVSLGSQKLYCHPLMENHWPNTSPGA